MEERLRDLICGSRTLHRGDHSLRVLSARELLSCKAEAETLCRDPEAMGLWRNACILSRSWEKGSIRVFPNGAAVLDAMSAEEIAGEMAAYSALASRVDVSCGDEKEVNSLLEALRREPMERIRWRVLKAFGVLPSEERAQKMTEGDYLYCALQLLLDRERELERLCPECRDREGRCRVCGKPLTGERATNSGFDLKKFEELKHHG